MRKLSKSELRALAEAHAEVQGALVRHVAALCKEAIDTDPFIFVLEAGEGIRSDGLFGREIEELFSLVSEMVTLSTKLEEMVNNVAGSPCEIKGEIELDSQNW